MYDFPASPTVGDAYQGWVWNGTLWSGGPGLAPPVSEQFFDLAGKASQDITVPSWAKAAELTGCLFFPAATQQGVGLYISLDGTTFLSGASDYNWMGPYHTLSPALYGAQQSTPGAYFPIATNHKNITTPVSFETTINLIKTSSQGFCVRTYTKEYNETAGTSQSDWWFGWTAPSGATAIKALRISATTLAASSWLKVKWLGDQATIPTPGNAIADAPSDGAWYLRQSGAWLKTSTLPTMQASLNIGTYTLTTGNNFGLLGAFGYNVGGWTQGPISSGGIGYDVLVPRTGRYWLNNRAYQQAPFGGRLDLTRNGTALNVFVNSFLTAGDGIIEASVIVDLVAGDRIGYRVSVANFGGHFNPAHTEVKAAMIGG